MASEFADEAVRKFHKQKGGNIADVIDAELHEVRVVLEDLLIRAAPEQIPTESPYIRRARALVSRLRID